MGDYVSATQAAALAAPIGRFGIFFRMAGTETEAPLLLWSGIQNRDATMPAPPMGEVETYKGLGTLVDAPEISHIVNGESDDISFSISGISSAADPYLVANPPKVRGRLVQLGLGIFDENWQLVGNILPIGLCTASHLSFKADPPSEDGGSTTYTLTLITQLGDTSRSRGAPVFWSPAQWKAAHENSTFTDDVGRLQRGVTPAWPSF